VKRGLIEVELDDDSGAMSRGAVRGEPDPVGGVVDGVEGGIGVGTEGGDEVGVGVGVGNFGSVGAATLSGAG
jgi:hypothetical protein